MQPELREIIVRDARLLLWKLMLYTYERIPALGRSVASSRRHDKLVGLGRLAALRYAHARHTNGYGTWEPKSSFFPSLAKLMARIALPDYVFKRGSKKIAIEVATCILQFEGFSGDLQSFARHIENQPLPPANAGRRSNVKMLAKAYAKVLRDGWEFTAEFDWDAFEEVESFIDRNGNDLFCFSIR